MQADHDPNGWRESRRQAACAAKTTAGSFVFFGRAAAWPPWSFPTPTAEPANSSFRKLGLRHPRIAQGFPRIRSRQPRPSLCLAKAPATMSKTVRTRATRQRSGCVRSGRNDQSDRLRK